MAAGSARHVVELDESACLELLSSSCIGRLAYTERALPAVTPVSYGVVGRDVVIPVRVGSTLADAGRGAVVALQVDDLDATHLTGWDVTAVGPSRVVTDLTQVNRLAELGIRPWVIDGRDGCYLVVSASVLRGRRTVAS